MNAENFDSTHFKKTSENFETQKPTEVLRSSESLELGEVKPEEIPDSEKYLSRKESIEKGYKDVINWREKKYNQDVKADPPKESMRSNLDTHNDIVLDYAIQLSEEENLDSREKVAVMLATIMHDSGKLSSSLLSHHEKGVEYAKEMFQEMLGKKIGGVEINEEVINKALEAIERHMNHPFLVMMNKGEKFPVPQDKVDKVVYDADMLANIGFKNVAFRIIDKGLLDKDSIRAKNKNILEESFRNVLEGEITDDGKKISGATGLQEIVLSDSAKKIAKQSTENVRAIFENLKEEGGIREVQKLFSDEEGNFNLETIKKRGGVELIKKILNEKIQIAAMELKIDSGIAKKFEM